MKHSWYRRRWLDFRLGHQTYLIFALTFSNFILIFHRLLIERIPFLDEYFSNLIIFAIIFAVIYIPIAVIFGAWHRKTQIQVETDMTMRHNPFLAHIYKIMVEMMEGSATKEEIDELKKYLNSIEKGTPGKYDKDTPDK
ncbi:MAG: hypothetical protein ACE5DL_00080 [Nitrosopumilaceae archaeon]